MAKKIAAALPPVVDDRILVRGTSHLRTLSEHALEAIRPGTVILIQNGAGAKRLAVILRYDDFIALQKAANAG